MSGSSSAIVAGLTAAALATVGFLAYQASANVPAEFTGPRAAASPGVPPSGTPRGVRRPGGPPDGSGRGARVVYSLADDRVWLIGRGGEVRRTFRVSPGAVDPLPGVHGVTSRSDAVRGSDGVPVEHVVRFADVDGVSIGFSAAVDGSVPARPKEQTGGIRETRADGDAMWEFATYGRKVVVVR
ncbi:hypothetical protein ABZ354_15060 [Streptomyces sp. NPDC005925]|uniref:hypothetical protein n=1 Tax=Streptomyces sp. NPDC005925 TaxID=3157172 RepID=UPI0033E05FFB